MADTPSIVLGVPSETFAGENRVAMVPAVVQALTKSGVSVWVERGAGEKAGYRDAEYEQKGARLASRDEVFANAQIIAHVRVAGANPAGRDDFPRYRAGVIVIGMADPLGEPAGIRDFASTRTTLMALELLPRITRAQSMDVLSSMASIAGYKAVLIAADHLPRIMPMMMTAAGTITPARVFVIGAGVAGLQAIATARRLGAVVEAYDVRPAVKEQVESLGAKFVELPLETGDSQDKGGYARAMDEAFYQKQRETMARVVAGSDVVIATAAVPGKKAPVLVTAEMLAAMRPGSVIVDIAAEQGGNCEVMRPGESVTHHGVTVLGPLNLASAVPNPASQMYG
ncbi:MAG TPA: NAD(P) transhydrogenase subunit alpha, partial [Candidatus Krumholzibacteria bacterium]|nr:NAD(P) transhydrogenase subunit alpha [Candidatus Krumholzibacteria bacterium]